MGSVNSAELPLPEHSCASIQLKCLRQEELGQIVAVPVCQSVFEDPSQFLFQMLYRASNEPSVRHWFINGTTPVNTEADRTAVVENDQTPEEFYHYLFDAEGAEPNTGCGPRTSVDADDARAQDQRPKATTRWMTIHIPAGIYAATMEAAGSDALPGFFSVETATKFFQINQTVMDNCWVVGYFECTHYRATKDSLTPPPSSMRHWMSKCFMTEGRSTVLFQIAAFMEARRMQLARLRTVNPTALEFNLRTGDCSSLRALESSFRRLFTATETAPGGAGTFVNVRPDEIYPQRLIKVCFDLPALDHLLPGLEGAVQGYCPPKQVLDDDGNILMVVLECGDLGEAVEEEDLKCKLQLPVDVVAKGIDQTSQSTPFSAAIATAKPLWAVENKVVQENSAAPRICPDLGNGTGPVTKNQAKKQMRKQFFLGLKNNNQQQQQPQGHLQKNHPQHAAANPHHQGQPFGSQAFNQQFHHQQQFTRAHQNHMYQHQHLHQQQQTSQPGQQFYPAQQGYNGQMQPPFQQQNQQQYNYQQPAPQVAAAPSNGGIGVSVAGKTLSCTSGCLAPHQNPDGSQISCCPTEQQ